MARIEIIINKIKVDVYMEAIGIIHVNINIMGSYSE